MTSAPRSTRGVVICAGPSAEHSMILIPCSGGAVAIMPPRFEGRIVAVSPPGEGVRTPTYWTGADRCPERRPERLRHDSAHVRAARALESRADGGRGALAPGREDAIAPW